VRKALVVVDMQNDFIDDLAGVRQELDIADW